MELIKINSKISTNTPNGNIIATEKYYSLCMYRNGINRLESKFSRQNITSHFSIPKRKQLIKQKDGKNITFMRLTIHSSLKWKILLSSYSLQRYYNLYLFFSSNQTADHFSSQKKNGTKNYYINEYKFKDFCVCIYSMWLGQYPS